MHQLTKKELKELPEGKWKGFVKLYTIASLCPPVAYMAREWIIEVDALHGARYLSVSSVTNWKQYNVDVDATSTGDLVYDGCLMQLYS